VSKLLFQFIYSRVLASRKQRDNSGGTAEKQRPEGNIQQRYQRQKCNDQSGPDRNYSNARDLAGEARLEHIENIPAKVKCATDNFLSGKDTASRNMSGATLLELIELNDAP